MTIHFRLALSLFAGLVLSGCAQRLGPTNPAARSEAIRRSLPAVGYDVRAQMEGSVLDMRTAPGFIEGLASGRRADVLPVIFVTTDSKLLALNWFEPLDRYAVPLNARCADILRVDVVSQLTIWTLTIETSEPKHVAIGRPDQTGLYSAAVFGGGSGLTNTAPMAAFYRMVVDCVRANRPGWEPSPVPQAAGPLFTAG